MPTFPPLITKRDPPGYRGYRNPIDPGMWPHMAPKYGINFPRRYHIGALPYESLAGDIHISDPPLPTPAPEGAYWLPAIPAYYTPEGIAPYTGYWEPLLYKDGVYGGQVEDRTPVRRNHFLDPANQTRGKVLSGKEYSYPEQNGEYSVLIQAGAGPFLRQGCMEARLLNISHGGSGSPGMPNQYGNTTWDGTYWTGGVDRDWFARPLGDKGWLYAPIVSPLTGLVTDLRPIPEGRRRYFMIPPGVDTPEGIYSMTWPRGIRAARVKLPNVGGTHRFKVFTRTPPDWFIVADYSYAGDGFYKRDLGGASPYGVPNIDYAVGDLPVPNTQDYYIWRTFEDTSYITGAGGTLRMDATVACDGLWHDVTFASTPTAGSEVLLVLEGQDAGGNPGTGWLCIDPSPTILPFVGTLYGGGMIMGGTP